MGGCSFTAHSVLGRPGNNPYCHYRALTLARAGKRERIEQAEPAPGLPFDHGRFDLILEPLDGSGNLGERIVIAPPPVLNSISREPRTGPNRIPPALIICRGCDQYVFSNETQCPHCGSDIRTINEEYSRNAAAAREAAEMLSQAIRRSRDAMIP